MSILRKRTRQDEFTILPNDTLQDENLSWKARGLLVYLLSMPDDWHFNQQDLKHRAADGRTSLQTGLDELEEVGYLERRQARDEQGNFSRNDWIVYESLNLRDDGGSDVDVKPANANCDDVGSPTTKNTSYKEPREQNKQREKRPREDQSEPEPPEKDEPRSVTMYRKTFPDYSPTCMQVDRIQQIVCEDRLNIWDNVLDRWRLNDYNPNNLSDMLDAYEEAVQESPGSRLDRFETWGAGT